jgi:hypothetical protein
MSKITIDRDALFTAALGTYESKGFTLNENEDCIELRYLGSLVDRFSWQVPLAAIRNSCSAWMIKNGDFRCSGIEVKGAQT